MKNGNLLIALVVGAVVGFVIGRTTTSSPSQAPTAVQAAARPSAAAPAAAQAAGEDAVYKVPVGSSYTKGPADAKVTIIKFSEYQCPFCNRVRPTIDQIFKEYGDDVRVVFKHNPLPFHQEAPLAAEAALAAGEQGKFWEMTDKLFTDTKKLHRPDLERYAQELNLDMAKFKAALDSNKFKAQVQADMAEAAKFGARGTPSFFINGRSLRGAQPFPAFKRVIDEEIKKADALLKKGVKPARLYAELTKDGLTQAAAPAPRQQAEAAPAPKVQKIDDLAGSPSKGPVDAKVTIVAWSDFECPFCARVLPTLEQITKEYSKDVRLVFKNQPLPFHKNAEAAGVAALAAHRQGKFWEYHDLLFANMKSLSEANYVKWAGELGLNVNRFKTDMADPALLEQVKKDSQYGNRVGANGTPTFFINGRELAGAQPFAAFKTIIDEEIKKADALIAKGVTGARLYPAILEENVKNAPKAEARPAAAPADDKPIEIDAGNSPFKGPQNAPVTIIAFSDFECPFCSRANPTIDQIMKEYAGKVKVVFKNQPLPFHKNAGPAAEAALAAGEQGKFWEFHDKAFANIRGLNRANYELWAQELGLNMGRFKAALDSGKFKAQVEADQTLANRVGASGTPTFFINGRKLVGAQPFEAFARLIDEELKK